ncbi:DMT family transporter [Ideonella oryzae]|uniref:DMT family transporter n=1 Tax=Ideonella oryzae TaxID=2937441 RepID=A0ABT1BP71_9BURK|nr:DMT family transporter [Ideonella oryzae]MCO5977948.1 DMT family transporter [Ideonella oryzae]
MPLSPSSRVLAYASLAASMALVGSYVGLSKLLVAVFPIFLLAWLRFGLAALAMVRWVKRSPCEPPLSPADRRLLFLESFLGNFLFSICMLFGVAATSAVAAGVVMAGIPAAVALLSRAWLKEALHPRVMAGVACAVAGIALLALSRHGSSAAAPAPWWGYALLLGAVFCEACYMVIGKKLTAQVSPRRISALINLWGLALVTPLGLWQALRFDFGAVHLAHWGLLGFYALAASVVTVWLWMKGLRHVPAQQAGVFSVLLPLSATAVGVLFLGESLAPAQLLALGLALAGLLLATWPQRNTPAPRAAG